MVKFGDSGAQVASLLPSAETFDRSLNCPISADATRKLDMSEVTNSIHLGFTLLVVLGVFVTLLGLFGSAAACHGSRGVIALVRSCS